VVESEGQNASAAATDWAFMPGMETFVAKHAVKIRGTLSCFDRVLFRGYLPLMSGWSMADFLWSKRIDRKMLKPFLLEQAERIKNRPPSWPQELGAPTST
jgi:hypothetical protein